MLTRTKPIVSKLIQLLLIALALRTIWNIYQIPNLLDFSSYYVAAQAFLQGNNPYHIPPLPFLYPPAALFAVIPFATLELTFAQIAWSTFSLACLVTSIWFLLTKRDRKMIILCTAICLNSFPFKFTLGLGQINLFVLLGFSLTFFGYNQKKSTLSGIALGLSTALKTSPIILFPIFIIQRHIKVIILSVITFLSLNLIADVVNPFPLFSTYLELLLKMLKGVPAESYYNQSLTATVLRLTSPTISSLVSVLLRFVLCITTILVSIRYKQPSLNLFSLFLITALLISPITWQHHLVWTLPAFIALYQSFNSSFPPQAFILYLIALLLISFNFKTPEQFPQLLISHATFGLLILYGLLMYSLKKLPKKKAPSHM